MSTTTSFSKSLAQLQAESFPLKCCEGAKAVVEMYDQAHFLAGKTQEHIVRCSKCLREVHPVTRTTLES